MNENEHPYGSWKDVKYQCNFIKNFYNLNDTAALEHPFVKSILNFATDSLRKEIELDFSSPDSVAQLSLIARWLPREKSKKFGWLYNYIAKKLYPTYSDRKARTHLRLKLSFLNKKLDTIQIKQCGKNWADIDHKKTTSITLRKQKNALLNVTKKGAMRESKGNTRDYEDRMKCRDNLMQHIDNVKNKKDKATIHGRRCNVGELVKDALSAQNSSQEVKDTVNLQWEDNSKNNEGLENIIACCDTSGSMEVDDCIPLYNAMGLSIRTSEICHPTFQNRILTFDAQPQWIVLDKDSTFCEKVVKVKRSAWGIILTYTRCLI